MKALVGAFNQEKALVGAFSVIVQPVVEPMDRFTALVRRPPAATHSRLLRPAPGPGLGSQQQGEEVQDQDILRILCQQVGILSVVRGRYFERIVKESLFAVTAWCTAQR